MAATTVDHEYLPIDGLKEFTSAAAALLLGHQAAAIRENRVRGHMRSPWPPARFDSAAPLIPLRLACHGPVEWDARL